MPKFSRVFAAMGASIFASPPLCYQMHTHLLACHMQHVCLMPMQCAAHGINPSTQPANNCSRRLLSGSACKPDDALK